MVPTNRINASDLGNRLITIQKHQKDLSADSTFITSTDSQIDTPDKYNFYPMLYKHTNYKRSDQKALSLNSHTK